MLATSHVNEWNAHLGDDAQHLVGIVKARNEDEATVCIKNRKQKWTATPHGDVMLYDDYPEYGTQRNDVHALKRLWLCPEIRGTDHPANYLGLEEGAMIGERHVAVEVVRLDADERTQTWSHKAVLDALEELYYWREANHNQGGVEEGWLVFGRCRDGTYVSVQSECAYTGFHIWGSVRFYVSQAVEKIWWLAHTDVQRNEMLS